MTRVAKPSVNFNDGMPTLCWLVRIDIALPEVMQCVWYMSVCHWYERMLFYTAGIFALSG